MEVQHGKGLSPWGSDEDPRVAPEPHARLLFFTRYVVPGLIALAGVVTVIVASDRQIAWEIGGMFMGAAIAVSMLIFFLRMGVSSDRDPAREEDALEYFYRHCHWPDERPGRAG